MARPVRVYELQGGPSNSFRMAAAVALVLILSPWLLQVFWSVVYWLGQSSTSTRSPKADIGKCTEHFARDMRSKSYPMTFLGQSKPPPTNPTNPLQHYYEVVADSSRYDTAAITRTDARETGNMSVLILVMIIMTIIVMVWFMLATFITKRNIKRADSQTRTALSPALSKSNSATAMSRRAESSSVSSESNIATSDSGCNSVVFFRFIDQDGGILTDPNAATSLLFSPHSISNQIDITLEILHNPVVFPDLREDETLVSPIVFCGPHGWTFHKPVLLTFPHCGMSDRDDFTLLVTETSSQQAPDWMEVSSATPGIEYFVRDSECLVYISHFTGFSLKSKGPKQVRLLAFSSVSDHLYRLRVYCINDTKDVIDRIKKEEQEFGFKQTDRGVSMTFLKNKHDLYLRAHLETPGWKFLNSSELVISYESVRRKRDSNVLFKLQAEPEHKKDTAILSLSLCAFQDGNSDSPTYSIAEELPVAPGQTEMRKLGPTSCDHKGACNCKTPSQVCMVHSADITDQTFLNSLGSHRSRHLTIPHKLRTQLCIKLDPPKYCGDDWRSLASELGLDELIEYFSSKENPTELVLQEFDKTGKTLKDLRDILTGIGRPDAASLVQEHLQTTNRDLPSPSNDSGVGSPDTSETDSTPSLGSDKMFFPNSPSQSGERNSPQCMHCEESVPSHELYNSCANTGASGASERSTTTGSTCNKKVFQNSSSQSEERNSPQDMSCGESVASHELCNSCTNTEASGRNTKHFLTRF